MPHMAMEYWENILVRLVFFFFMASSSFYSMLFLEWAQKNKQKKRKTKLSSSAIILPFTLSSFSALLVLYIGIFTGQLLLWRRPKVMHYPHFCYHELMNSQL